MCRLLDRILHFIVITGQSFLMFGAITIGGSL